jgi:hypothetical protein
MMTSKGDWLTDVFREAEDMFSELPSWAQPVLTRPMAAASNGDLPSDADEPDGRQSSIDSPRE